MYSNTYSLTHSLQETNSIISEISFPYSVGGSNSDSIFLDKDENVNTKCTKNSKSDGFSQGIECASRAIVLITFKKYGVNNDTITAVLLLLLSEGTLKEPLDTLGQIMILRGASNCVRRFAEIAILAAEKTYALGGREFEIYPAAISVLTCCRMQKYRKLKFSKSQMNLIAANAAYKAISDNENESMVYSSTNIDETVEKSENEYLYEKERMLTKGTPIATELIVEIFSIDKSITECNFNDVLATLILGKNTLGKSENGKEALNIASINDKRYVVLAMSTAKRTHQLGGGKKEMRCAVESIFEFIIGNLEIYDKFDFKTSDVIEISDVAAQRALKDMELKRNELFEFFFCK